MIPTILATRFEWRVEQFLAMLWFEGENANKLVVFLLLAFTNFSSSLPVHFSSQLSWRNHLVGSHPTIYSKLSRCWVAENQLPDSKHTVGLGWKGQQ
ncbi:hypothetical protein [Tunicatimonas pelagia]|uniref:hypothetical protein n=1 Tax=Tunicatimonas pelagia TaxID=931531 RepID=UPI002666C8A1|nr:hypothetical protein [Tunicatimonas pelagia]WKN43321.1 hypothetical protein P0M28_30215 [Tunicatimonas pelagia]